MPIRESRILPQGSITLGMIVRSILLLAASALLVLPMVLLTLYVIENPGRNIGVALAASDLLAILAVATPGTLASTGARCARVPDEGIRPYTGRR